MKEANSGEDFIDVMTPEERNRNGLLLLAVFFAVFSLGGGNARTLVLLFLAAVFLSNRKPGNTAFVVRFQRWFKEELFPQMSQRLQAELEERSKRPNQGIFNALRDSAQSFLLDKTQGVRAELAWAAFSTTFAPSYRDFYFFRTASVNMGTRNAPVYAVFVGINQEWYLSPHIKLDFDSISVLRMLEGGNDNTSY